MTSTFSSDLVIHTVSYGWTGTADASPSVQLTDGVETRRNLAPNPSFTTNTNSWQATSNVTLTRDTTVAHSGVASGKVVATVPTSGSVSRAIMLTLAVSEDTDYIVSFWVYVPTDLTAAYRMRMSANVGGVVDSTDTIQAATTGWQRVSIQYHTPVGATTLYFNPMLSYDPGTATDTFYIDDVMIETGVGVGEYFDGNTPASADTAEVVPLLVTQWNATATTRHIVHPLLGNVWPDITVQPAEPRSGTMSALFENEADANLLFTMLTGIEIITFSDDSTSVTAMRLLANGQITIQQDDQNRRYWTVTFTYLEVQ